MKKENSHILKGNIVYSRDKENLIIKENSYLVVVKGLVEGIYKEIPSKYQDLPLKDYKDSILIPGLVDLHVHAPQYAYRGLGMDMELLDWLEAHAFPEEAKYGDNSYAEFAYRIFVEDLYRSATTRACIFASRHGSGSSILMRLLDQAGLRAYVGKVNMDRNCPDYICEGSAAESLEETKKWIEESLSLSDRVKPILTPRFVPTCSDELMVGLGLLQKKYQLPVQSHLSENPKEIEWVSELCPWSKHYGDVYRQFGLFGGENCKTVMAHCVYSGEKELDLIKKRGVYIAHCPQSNMNVSSGIAPIRSYLDKNLKVGLGSDIAGGSSLSIFRAMVDAITSSKLYWRLVNQDCKPLDMEAAFYMASKGGGEFFGKVGSFETGYEADVLVLNDERLKHPQKLSVRDRLERMVYLSDEREIIGKYVAGEELFSRLEKTEN
ncbi:MAG TPA: amidohydrolase family protein [Lachnospiraceae bacterium]